MCARSRVVRNCGNYRGRQQPPKPSQSARAIDHGADVVIGFTRNGCNSRFRQMDFVVRLHRVERTLPRQGALFIDPSALDLPFDLVV